MLSNNEILRIIRTPRKAVGCVLLFWLAFDFEVEFGQLLRLAALFRRGLLCCNEVPRKHSDRGRGVL